MTYYRFRRVQIVAPSLMRSVRTVVFWQDLQPLRQKARCPYHRHQRRELLGALYTSFSTRRMSSDTLGLQGYLQRRALQSARLPTRR